jgi:hypothetical protein
MPAPEPLDFLTDANLLLEWGGMTTDLDARHHKIINLDTSNLTFPQIFSATFVFGGLGSLLVAGIGDPIKVPFGGTLLGWTMMCSPSGSVTADVVRAANGAGLPVTSIVGAGVKPAISSNVENSGSNFTGWTSIVIADNDNLAINLSGISLVTYMELTLHYK